SVQESSMITTGPSTTLTT
nr:immunoglobulin heavy chain junction region [Mus musculus]